MLPAATDGLGEARPRNWVTVLGAWEAEGAQGSNESGDRDHRGTHGDHYSENSTKVSRDPKTWAASPTCPTLASSQTDGLACARVSSLNLQGSRPMRAGGQGHWARQSWGQGDEQGHRDETSCHREFGVCSPLHSPSSRPLLSPTSWDPSTQEPQQLCPVAGDTRCQPEACAPAAPPRVGGSARHTVSLRQHLAVAQGQC